MTPRVRITKEGAVYAMYGSREHPKPHLHIRAAGRKASVSIETGELIVGSLSTKHLKAAQEWIQEHRDELLHMWEHRMEPGIVHLIEGRD